METFAIIVISIGILHFLYESIVLPSIIKTLRYKFESIKDDVILSVIQDKNSTTPQEFNYMMFSLELCEKDIENMRISSVIKILSSVRNEPNFKDLKTTEAQLSSKSEIKSEYFKKLHKKSSKYIMLALLANSFMLIFYLLPLIILILMILPIFGSLKNRWSRMVINLTRTTDKEFEKMPLPSNVYCIHN